jgi:hypothetical protein
MTSVLPENCINRCGCSDGTAIPIARIAFLGQTVLGPRRESVGGMSEIKCTYFLCLICRYFPDMHGRIVFGVLVSVVGHRLNLRKVPVHRFFFFWHKGTLSLPFCCIEKYFYAIGMLLFIWLLCQLLSMAKSRCYLCFQIMHKSGPCMPDPEKNCMYEIILLIMSNLSIL